MSTIRVISLKTDTQRRDVISKELRAAGLHYKFIDAVDGKELRAAEYWAGMRNSDFLFNRRLYLSPAEVGCKLSHMAAIVDYLETKDPDEMLMILEDDVFPRKLGLAFDGINQVIKSFGERPVILHLGGQDGLRNSVRVIKRRRRQLEKIAGTGLSIFEPLGFTTRWLYRTCGYATNCDGAKLLLRAYTRLNIPADNWRAIIKIERDLRLLFSNVVGHPTDLSASHIECERISKVPDSTHE